jgi:hypothetical protein
MKLSMNDSRIDSISQLREFVKGSKKFEIKFESIDEKYKFINRVVKKFRYRRLSKGDKHDIRMYLKKLTGYKKAQLNRLIKRANNGNLKRVRYVRKKHYRRYNSADIRLLEITDALHRRLNRFSTKEILRREAEVFKNSKYKNISKVSASHIDNLRKTNSYHAFWINGTKSREISIGKTKEPEPNGRPGSMRIDTVHQRDVYHINAVDEITQWEVIVCVPQISERYLLPGLKRILSQFPFKIFNFHSDRGSEYVNHVVANLLNKLLIEHTKSRSRHSNDNALIESKNGTVIRKNLGYVHINFRATEMISNFFEKWFNPYLNYHRPCLFLIEERIDSKGRIHKVYGGATTPYEKLKEVSKRLKVNFLKKGVTFKKLNLIAYKESDNKFTHKMRKQETKIFDIISKMKG